jgi:hypothetical protein
MSGFARVNGLACTVGTLYSLNANAFLITVKVAAGTAVDLRAEDDAVDEVVEMLVKELNPLMFFVTNSAAGTVHVVFDKNISSAAELQTRIRNMGTAVGANGIDVTGTTVALASSITIA